MSNLQNKKVWSTPEIITLLAEETLGGGVRFVAESAMYHIS